MPTEQNPCVLKPGETCAFCNHTRPAKQTKERALCSVCGEPFVKGQRRRLYRGKWRHVNVEGCL